MTDVSGMARISIESYCFKLIQDQEKPADSRIKTLSPFFCKETLRERSDENNNGILARYNVYSFILNGKGVIDRVPGRLYNMLLPLAVSV